MPSPSERVNGRGGEKPLNRGPAAAADNRAAILRAARRVFTDRGYRIPFSAIAKAAGVSQAVMYRHFPSKLDVALAVFEENLVELEAIAAGPDPDAFWRTWDRLVTLTIESSAFVEMAVEARLELPDYTGTSRLEALLDTCLRRAQIAGVAPPGLTVFDVLLTERMVYGVVASATTPHIRDAVDQALGLVTWVAARA